MAKRASELVNNAEARWPRLLGMEQLATYLSVAVETVRKHSARGDVPGKRRLGRRCVFDRRVVDDWLDKGDEYRDLWVDGARLVK